MFTFLKLNVFASYGLVERNLGLGFKHGLGEGAGFKFRVNNNHLRANRAKKTTLSSYVGNTLWWYN